MILVSGGISISHLFCTLISENPGLEKSRSILNLRKISGPAQLNFFSVHLNFFSVCHLNFFQIYTINLKKSRWQTEKKLRCTEKKFRCARPEIFLRFETDLNFSRPWFSEIKVQNKWLIVCFSFLFLFLYMFWISKFLSCSPRSTTLLISHPNFPNFHTHTGLCTHTRGRTPNLWKIYVGSK